MRAADWVRAAVVLLLAGGVCGEAVARSPVVLARDGQPAASIVLAPEASVAARFAAAELQEHIARITGAQLPIISDAAAPETGARLLVGESAATRALGLRSQDFGPQEHLVRFLPDTVVLIGRDADATSSAATFGPRFVPGRFAAGRQFDGRSSVISIPDTRFSDGCGSLEAWVWLPKDPQPTCHGTILRLDGDRPWTYHIIQRNMGTSCISYTTYDGSQGHGLASAELGEGWHHVLGTYDVGAGKMELFVDGRSVGTTAYVRTTCAGVTLGIGGMAQVGGPAVGNPFAGVIDEVRISKTVRRPEPETPAAPYALDADTLHLWHLDETAGDALDSATGQVQAAMPGIFEDRGSLDAVYDFLERYCDVRWYAPGEMGVVCPSLPTLAVKGRDVRRAPAMTHRWIAGTELYLPGPPDKVPGRVRHVWLLRQRLGGRQLTVGHSFYGYYERFLKAHPAWFAQGFTMAQPPQMCYTNPEFIAQVIQDASDYFDGQRAQPGAAAADALFGLVPMDNSEWCKCPRCQAELNRAEEKNQQFNNGLASDYIYAFTNRVACELRKTHPDKWIGQLAYSTYAYHPQRVRLEPNVSVQMCLHTRNWWCPSMEANDRKMLRDWRRQEPERPLYLWLYYCFPALNAQSGGFHYFPGFFAHSVARQMKLYAEAHITGIFLENSSECNESYLMDQLEFYVTFRLADDPTLDGEELIDEFFPRYYGSAGKPMRKLYARLEDTFSNPKYYPAEVRDSAAHQHQTEDLAWGSLGTEARMAEFGELMAQARGAARTAVEKQRVACFEKGIWDYMVEGRRKYVEHRRLKAQPPPRVKVPRLASPAAGDLARVAWSQAVELGPWGSLSGDPAGRRIEARLACDGTHLYVQFTDPVETGTLVSGGQVWDGDDWELIFGRQRGKPYRQLIVAPNNQALGLLWDQQTQEWAAGAVTASDTKDRHLWTVRLAVPLERLVEGGLKPGVPVYANFYRGAPEARARLAWVPTFAAGFHDTARLAELVFE